tara:strand:- start:3495 stop:4157 length:663 start_codon:yes stop_codon:yes gene_type:complete
MNANELNKLKAELKHIKIKWGSLSLSAKILTGLSLLFSISSITSLSDVIFKWRGFIKDALDVYREYFSEPVSRFLVEYAGIHLEQTEADIFFLIVIVIGVVLRSLYHEIRRAYDPEAEDVFPGLVGADNPLYWIVIISAGPFVSLLVLINPSDQLDPVSHGEPVFSFYLKILYIFVTTSLTVFMHFYMYSSATKKLMVLNVAVIVCVILALGAVNAGLSA